MNIEVSIGKTLFPKEMTDTDYRAFADQFATHLRKEDDHNVSIFFVDGDGVEVTNEGVPAHDAQEIAEVVKATLDRKRRAYQESE